MPQKILGFLNENSSALTAISVIFAAIFWVLKITYTKHQKQVSALNKLEVMFAYNERVQRDNIGFLNQWINLLNSLRPFNCHFGKIYTDEENILLINNNNLVNEVFVLNYKIKRLDDDLRNVYKSYWEVIPKLENIQQEDVRNKNLTIYHANVLTALKIIKDQMELLPNECITVIAHIQVMQKIRFHSLFGYLNLLFTDIIPKITSQKISTQTNKIKDQLKEKSTTSLKEVI